MKSLLKILTVLLLSVPAACTGPHLITDNEYLKQVKSDFEQRRTLAAARDEALFGVFKERMSLTQKEALEFLFAYMPLSDLADYGGSFFKANTDRALKSRAMVPWGRSIPDDIFLHYVLPPRVNNENLDSFRIVFFDEIHNRIKGLDIEKAALEINHWCLEKVSYQPSDSRTSSPMSTVLSARGRCGEESTFTVAALRTAGIPARQVYTPRWAHSDDNHAWVEIWSGGKWYYMGACEPEPVLDRGWFTEPARRAMLIHTRSYGASSGNENAIGAHKYYTEVNNLSKYALTKKISVRVLDRSGLPSGKATVEFQLYNYAEFYPLAVLPVDKSGLCSFETGYGDLLVWAYEGDDFAFARIPAEAADTLTLFLSGNPGGDMVLDLEVPPELPSLPGPPAEMVKANSERISRGNAIRQKYIDSWQSHSGAVKIAIGLGTDSARTAAIFARSMGNYREVKKLLYGLPDSLRDVAVSLLEILPDKDIRDFKASILAGHLVDNSSGSSILKYAGNPFYLENVLNPRIANEMLSGWRNYFRNTLPGNLRKEAPGNPELVVRYLEENIKIADEDNFYRTPLTPVGVNELRVSDSWSESICFVAICRSLGIPSRLEPARRVPQYFSAGQWNDVRFSGQAPPQAEKAFLRLSSTDRNPVPEYYRHFTIARFEKGKFKTLEYEYNTKASGFGELEVLPGRYMLVTGNRTGSGRILATISFFELSAGDHREVIVNLRKDESDASTRGSFRTGLVASLFPDSVKIKAVTSEKGVVAAWIDPGLEPTKHVFSDLPPVKNELDAWGGYFLFLNASESSSSPGKMDGLPEKSLFGTDVNMIHLKKAISLDKWPDIRLPFIIAADKNGKIIYVSSGYRIGTGEQVLKHLVKQ